MPLRRLLPAAALAAALLGPAPLRAEPRIAFENIRHRSGWLEVDLRLRDGFDAGVGESLDRGLPTTVRYAVELWRSRSRWFDRLERTRHLAFEIEYDLWTETYVVRASDGTVREAKNRAELEAIVLRPSAIRIAPIEGIDGRSPHYFSARAEVRPLELEQIREIEAWLQGKIPGEEDREESGGLFGIPEKVFGFVASFAGFGEETVEAKSIVFRPEALE